MTSRGVVIAPVMAPSKKSKPRVDGSDLSGRGNKTTQEWTVLWIINAFSGSKVIVPKD